MKYKDLITNRIIHTEIIPKRLRKSVVPLAGEILPEPPIFHKLPPVARKPKLLYIVPHLFIGGAETQLFYLIKQLQDRYDQRLIVTQHRSWAGSSMWDTFSELIPCEYARDWDRERLALACDQSDVVIFHGNDEAAEALSLVKTKPVVLQVAHTYSDDWTLRQYRIYPHSTLVCVAGWIELRFQQSFHGRDSITIWNGADPIKANATEKKIKKTVGYLGRLAPGKNVGLLIDALEYLPEHYEVLVKGWGEQEELLKEKAQAFPPRVRFSDGDLGRESFFQDIDLLCLPSDSEGNSMVIIEAILADLPIVTTNVGAIPEFRDRGALFHIIEKKTPEGIAHAILQDTQHDYSAISDQLTSAAMADKYDHLIQNKFRVPQQIEIHSQGGIGDWLMSLPTIQTIEATFPDSKFSLVIDPKNRGVVEATGFHGETHYTLTEGKGVDPSAHKVFLSHEVAWRQGGHIIDRRACSAGVELLTRSSDFISKPVEMDDLPEQFYVIHRCTPFASKSLPIEFWQNLIDSLELPVLELGYPGDPLLDTTIPCFLSLPEAADLCKHAKGVFLVDSCFVHICKALDIEATVFYGRSTEPAWCGYNSHKNIISESDCPVAHTCQCAKFAEIPCAFEFECVGGANFDYFNPQ